jgi:hypothetical protein
MMAVFVRFFAQKVTAEICPVEPFVYAQRGHELLSGGRPG